MVAVSIQVQGAESFVVVQEIEPGLFLARARDVRVQAYGTTHEEALRKVASRLAHAQDDAA